MRTHKYFAIVAMMMAIITTSCTKTTVTTVANPILPSDFSDPDVIRVGNKYYMTCSEFHYMGMPIMESEDLINWRVITQIYDSIPLPGYSEMERYGQGTWAPSLRYHDGKFWIFVCTPYDGLFMTNAERPEGPWSPLHCVKKVERWEDPCPFWDEDGQAYLGHSLHGAGPIIVHKMASDGSRLLDDGVVVYTGPVAEGTKFHKINGWYYLSIPEGGVGTGWQMALRSKSIYGPYEGHRVLEQGATAINGPHQGALVDTPDGQWWFFHFQDTHPLGRIVHLQPVVWHDDFPVIGEDYDGNSVGEPMPSITLPVAPLTARQKRKSSWIGQPVTTFTDLQWQWNHNPHLDHVNITRRTLTLHPLPAGQVREASNQYTLKTYGRHNQTSVRLSISDMQPGERAGLECLGRHFQAIGVEMKADAPQPVPYIYTETDGIVTYHEPLQGNTITLQLQMDCENNTHQFAYAKGKATPQPCGEPFQQHSGDWKGARIGLYAYRTSEGPSSPGHATFTHFTYHPEK